MEVARINQDFEILVISRSTFTIYDFGVLVSFELDKMLISDYQK